MRNKALSGLAFGASNALYLRKQQGYSPQERRKYLLCSIGQVSEFRVCWHPEHCRRLFGQRSLDMRTIEVMIHSLWLGHHESRCQAFPSEKSFVEYFLHKMGSSVFEASLVNVIFSYPHIPSLINEKLPADGSNVTLPKWCFHSVRGRLCRPSPPQTILHPSLSSTTSVTLREAGACRADCHLV